MAVLDVEGSLFVVNAAVALRRIERESRAGFAASCLVAVDEELGEPRWCTALERGIMVEALRRVCERLRLALEAVAGVPLVDLGGLALGPHAVAVAGWLIEYPVLCCLRAATAPGAEQASAPNCLARKPLRLYEAFLPPTGSKLLAFSVPEALVDAEVAARIDSSVSEWRARLAEAGLCSVWGDVDLRVSTVVLPQVAL